MTELEFPSTGDWDRTEILPVTLQLAAGSHEVIVRGQNGAGPDIHDIYVRETDASVGTGGQAGDGAVDSATLVATAVLVAAALPVEAEADEGGDAAPTDYDLDLGALSDGKAGSEVVDRSNPAQSDAKVGAAVDLPLPAAGDQHDALQADSKGQQPVRAGFPVPDVLVTASEGSRLAPVPEFPQSADPASRIDQTRDANDLPEVSDPDQPGTGGPVDILPDTVSDPVADDNNDRSLPDDSNVGTNPGTPQNVSETDVEAENSASDPSAKTNASGAAPRANASGTPPSIVNDDITTRSPAPAAAPVAAAPAINEDIMALPIVFQDTQFAIIGADSTLRNPSNPEPTADGSANFDANGLRVGFSGEGYLDLGGPAGQKFSVVIPAADVAGPGTYTLVVKYANGGSGTNAARPLAIYNGGTQVGAIANTNTGSFSVWETQTIDIVLSETNADGDYVLTFEQTELQGPNIDGVALVEQGGNYSFLAPEFAAAQTLQIVEGQTVVDLVTATDADGQQVAYAITGGADAALFTINDTTGELSFLTAPTYTGNAADDSYDVEITATDEAGDSTVQAFTVSVSDYFEPIYVQAETGTISRPDGGTPVSKMMTQTNGNDEGPSAVDAFGLRPNYSGEGYLDFGSTGEMVSYDIVSPTAGTYQLHIRYASSTVRNAQVMVDGAVVATIAFPVTAGGTQTDPFNNWKVLTTEITLAAGQNDVALYLNSGNGPNIDALAITGIGDTPDFAPRFDVPGQFAMDENETAIGSVAASDVVSDTTTGQTPDPVSYSITGGADQGLLSIDPSTGALSLNAAADYESKSSYAVEVTATDGGGNQTTQAVTVTVNDVDEAPSAPAYTGPDSFADDVAAGAVIGSVSAVDPEGAAVTYTLSDARFEVANGDIVVAAGAVFDAGEAIDLTVTASDGSLTSSSSFALNVTGSAPVDQPPSVPVYDGPTTISGSVPPGEPLGTVTSTDPEGQTVTFTVSDSRFEIVDGQLFLVSGAVFDPDETVDLTITASDGTLTSSAPLSLTVTPVVVPPTGSTLDLVFTPGNVVGYSGSQDGGNNFAVTNSGATLELNDNHWKRAYLGTDYTITADTQIAVDVMIGPNTPEIVAVGFDLNDNGLDTGGSVYALDGTDSHSRMIDLKGTGIPQPDGSTRYFIDLGAHAGKVIDSLVFVSDDDSPVRGGLGTASFSNVQLIEAGAATGNEAPYVVGGGITDLNIQEGANIEVDLPFVDPEGEPLSYSVTITDGTGADVTDQFPDISFSGNVMLGTLPGLPGSYTVTVTADDGAATNATVSDSFTLSISNVNDAPTVASVALEPYVYEAGEQVEAIDISLFAEYFSDPDGDTLTLSVDPATLPDGLSYDPVTQLITGAPTEGGIFSVQVIATDAGGLTASLALDFEIDAPQIGDTFTIEAEDFTGLPDAVGFYAAAATSASGSQLIKTNANQSASITTDLGAGGVPAGYYTVSVTIYDETDGTATFSIDVGGVSVADDASFDDAGTWLNGDGTTGRGNAGQAGNRKTITFDKVVYVEAGTLLTLTGLADEEHLRFDNITLTLAEPTDVPPSAPVLDNASVAENTLAGVIGTLSAVDPDGGTVTFSTDDARFVIEGDQLRLADNVSLDHEAADVVSVEVTATDSDGNATAATLQIAVEDVNEAPVLDAAAAIADVTLAEGEGGNIDVAGGLGATDPEGDTLTYVAQLVGGEPLPAGLTLVGGELIVDPALAQGSYAVEVFASDGTLDSDSVQFTVNVGQPAPFQPFVLQAEDAAITLSTNPDGDATETVVRDPDNPETGGFQGLRPDFNGTGYIDYGDDPGDTLTFTIDVPADGDYVINVRYASQNFGGGERSLDIAVNGAAATTTVFPNTGTTQSGPTEGFNNWGILSLPVTLTAGSNTLSFTIPAGAASGPNIDQIEVTSASTADTSADEDGIPLFLSGPDADLTPTQAASINFNLAGIDLDIVKTEISFDGGATRVVVLPDADGDFTADGSALAPGSYTVTTYVTDEVGNEASATMTIVVATPVVDDFTIQAEDATQVTVDDTGLPTNADFTRVVDAANPDAFGNFRAGAVGDAYVDFGTNPGDAIVVNVDAPAAGSYTVTIRYANGGAGNRPLDVSVNGGAAESVDFVPGPLVAGEGWESWVTQTIQLDLVQGSNQIRLELPAGATNGPNIDELSFAFDGGTVVPPFTVTIEGETFDVEDLEPTGGVTDTVYRTDDNPEPNANAGNSGPGLEFDADGLRPGYEGEGYLDMGGEAGDSANFTVDVPDQGTYQLTVRYANGGNADRPMTLSINGTEQTVSFPQSTAPTGAEAWADWQEVTIDVPLNAGANVISLTNIGNAGPNIDNVTVSRGNPTGPVRDTVYFEEIIKINFEPAPSQTQQGLPAGYQTPAGFEADTGAAYGDRGNGFTYGWVTEDSVADGTANGTTPAAQPANAHWYKDMVPGATDEQKTYAHFEYPGAGASGSRAWEMALENGTYQVTLNVGDTAGAFDSTYAINVEGQSVMPNWVPANPIDGSTDDGEGFRSTRVTAIVQVTDGKLTIDSIGGVNTEIQSLEVERIPDLTPDDNRTADLDYSYFVDPVAANLDGQTSIAIGADGELPTGIDPTSQLVVGINLQAPGNRGPNVTYVDYVKLVETLTGEEVAINVQISGGADSVTIRPLTTLKENTSYTLKVEDVLDLGSVDDPTAPLRQMQDLSTTFVTGLAPVDVPREVAFATTTQLNGFADNAFGYTSIEFGPDGKLYIATITGEIHRWDVNADGSIDKASQETLSLDYLDAGALGRRGIIGMVFDPNDPNTIWISDNAPIPRESKAFDTPEFSGRVSKITLGSNGEFETATAETFAFGLPRSGGDHVTNSLEFRANPDFGEPGEPEYLLYLSQGSNSAAGSPDNNWGNRPERLLNASILEIDITKTAPAGGHDIRTEPIELTDVPTTSFPASEFNADGTYPGMYNPYDADAVVKIFATGVRNAYDLLWHSNGNLYVPTNGTASGGKTPVDPNQPGLDTTVSNSPKQPDFLFTVEEGGYYGHPVALRGEYVLNGGNPTAGQDPFQVDANDDTNSATDGYQVGVQPDPNWDLDGVYNLDFNRSPNGVTEYTGNAFGSNLKGAVIFAQFSVGDNVRYVTVDADGNITGDDVLRRPDGSVIDDYIDPLDIIENPVTGQLYLMTLNRGTGASQLILLTPAPGGPSQDITADENGDLALVAFDVSDPAAAIFQVNGLDDDITALRVSFNGAPATTVTLDSNNQFTIDLGALSGNVTAVLEVTDDALNSASASVVFEPGEEPTQLISLVTIQAEDKTPGDGTSVAVPTSPNAGIEIRDASNPEPGTTGLVNGLRPGAFGIDGNTDNTDGTPGGYADFGSTNEDFLSFTFDVPAQNAGDAVLQFRYANGGTADRPLQVEVNGNIVTVAAFAPTTAATTDESWANWQIVEIPAALVAGQNTVTLRSVNNTGPNIDQLEILVPTNPTTPVGDGIEDVNGVTYVMYEAENAALNGPVILTEDRTQSGNFVDFDGTGDQTITWTVTVTEAGEYGLDIIYALSSAKQPRPMALTINGTVVDTLPFAPNSNAAETQWGPQQTTVSLVAGVNTITVTAPAANGPNVDYLRVSQAPLVPFEPVPADIDGSGRIELEATDGSANTVSGSEAVFYFTVAADGVYQLDTASNAGAPNGRGLTWFLNGEEIEGTPFPGAGGAEESIFTTLQAGTVYELRIVSDAPGANALDYLDVSAAGGNANADIEVVSSDPTYFDNRLHFSYIENPVQSGETRDYKDSGVVRISNSGTEDLTIDSADLSGPFTITSPATLDGLTLAPGAFVDVTINFDRAAYTPPTSNLDGTSTVFQGRLRLNTNDADDPFIDVDLAGFWQNVPEGGMEPNVNEVWQVFGFGNRIEGLTLFGGGENSSLSTNDVFAKTDETEVLSPYWKLADGVTQAKVTQIAAFHGPGGATLSIHNPGNKGQQVTFWNHDGADNQRLLPNSGGPTSYATEDFGNGNIPGNWVGNGVFGISVAGLSTDPTLNPTGGVTVPGAQQGHTVKMFQALDADGNVIPNVYLGVMDYTGINYDYNDNMFVIEGVEPVGFGQSIEVSGLDDAAADDRLVFTNIDNPAAAAQEFRNETTFTLSNDGFAALTIESIAISDPANFQIVGTVPGTIPAGGSATVTVQYTGTHPGNTAGAVIQNATLTVTSNDVTNPQTVIQLAGIAQEFSENNSEPTVAQIVEAFGYGTDMAQSELAGGGIVETIGDEVLMPYLEKLDPSKNVEVIQLAAFLNYNNVARLGVHSLQSSDTTELFAQDDQQAQTILPDGLVPGTGDTGGVARATITGNNPFGLFVSVDGRPTYASWTDPEANRIDPDFGQLVGDDQGHLIRFFQALDADGNVIEGTYIAIQDYPGAGNYDYNDHMFVIKNVKPHQLTAAEDADGDGVNDALQTDQDADGTVAFFDPNDGGTTPNPGTKGDYLFGVNFGGGAIALDPVLNVALVGQNDSRVTLSGAVNPGAGTDNPNNPNGAGATAGSAFKTYEDGTNWNAAIEVPNGTYIVTLWTQETYFNAPGQRQFDATVNGQQVITNLDPFAEAGADTPIAYEVEVTVTNGTINIGMIADINNAPLNAVTIHEADDGTGPVNPGGGYVLGVNFGGGAIALDPVIGEALVGQNDPRVTISGSVNPAQGSDYATDPNGANATAGSAFKTYEDGSNWTASIEIPNGTYVVTLWTQETYWNSAGQRQFDATVNGQQVISNLDPFAQAGPDTPISFDAVVTVTNGKIDIGMVADIDNAALNAVTIHEYTSQVAEPGQTPVNGLAFQVGDDAISIDASDYDDGGQGIAYNDAPGLQGGTTNGRPGSSVEQTASGDIGWVANGEWLEYTINVAEDGLYDVSFLSAFGGSQTNRAIEASFRKGGQVYESTGSVDVDPTGGWTTFQETGSAQVQLEAGLQVMRVTFSGGSQDLSAINLTPADAVPVAQFASAMAAPLARSASPAAMASAAWDDISDDAGQTLSGGPDDLDQDDAILPSQLGNLFGSDLMS
ncbi:carbohydrate-binding protein [Paracoccus xiamenensis]|uniref:carbohydrate-binding protein n=1 Tax=Paracoccus xiamenensis TaxID=2714901 RepID=UPI001408239B|nr:carbohydrate-binding protein [Paracoccus xiamenensis]NHF74385.1 carbohydrate-binding protein [Paracoccus xiamenensis]